MLTGSEHSYWILFSEENNIPNIPNNILPYVICANHMVTHSSWLSSAQITWSPIAHWTTKTPKTSLKSFGTDNVNWKHLVIYANPSRLTFKTTTLINRDANESSRVEFWIYRIEFLVNFMKLELDEFKMSSSNLSSNSTQIRIDLEFKKINNYYFIFKKNKKYLFYF